MRVEDLMEHEVVTLRVDDTLGLADDVMRLGRIRHLPVVSGDGDLVGILSQRDLFRAGLSSVVASDVRAQRSWLGSLHIRDVMTPAPVTVPPETPIRRAVELMLARRIGCLPVVVGTRLVGLLSESDCLRHLAHLLRIGDERAALPDLGPAS